MNHRLICNVLGRLLLLLAGSMFLCDFWGWVAYQQRDSFHEFALLAASAISALGGGALLLLGRNGGNKILRKEAIAIVGLGWIVAALAGALPYLFTEPRLDIAGAIFESASGFTTTGASVMKDIEAMPEDILLWRATTQWLGGGGILVLFVALLSSLGVGSKSLFRHESTVPLHAGFYSRIRELAAKLWQIYLVITLVAIAGMLLLGSSFYDAIVFVFAAISTGGFAPYNLSAGGLQSPAMEVWLTIVMAVGGMNFLLLAAFLRRQFLQPLRDEECRLYFVILAVATLLVFIPLCYAGTFASPWDALRHSAFQVVSIMTTTGFSTVDYSSWPSTTLAVIFVLMFIGGCVGSTAGGLKIQRILILGKSFGQQIVHAFRPNQIFRVRVNERIVGEDDKAQALTYLALAFPILLVSVIFLTFVDPHLDLATNGTAVIATFTNVGPGFGEVGPAGNYSSFSPAGLLLLSFLMILGRLELFALLALFLPSLWKKY